MPTGVFFRGLAIEGSSIVRSIIYGALRNRHHEVSALVDIAFGGIGTAKGDVTYIITVQSTGIDFCGIGTPTGRRGGRKSGIVHFKQVDSIGCTTAKVT